MLRLLEMHNEHKAFYRNGFREEHPDNTTKITKDTEQGTYLSLGP
ncbi:MAG: hypothetical protein NTW96_00720 [Planctomycetia bacterium]|nr:hypothetical protein [Planctomycetia bacterium]